MTIRRSIAIVLLVLATAMPGRADMIISSQQFDAALLVAVNEVRVSHGLRPFAADARLTVAAQRHAADMAEVRRMEHELAGRPKFPARLRAAGARVRTGGENILRSDLGRLGAGCQAAAALPAGELTVALARDSLRRWMGSPKHRESILNPRFRRTGAAFAVVTARDACGQIYVAQVFGG